MLEEVHRILTIALGEPPLKFDWTFRDKEKNYKSFKNQSPLEFYRDIVGYPLENTVSLINDPRNEMNQVYTVEYLGNVIGGRPVTYINVPIDQLKSIQLNLLKIIVQYGLDVMCPSSCIVHPGWWIWNYLITSWHLEFNWIWTRLIDWDMEKVQWLMPWQLPESIWKTNPLVLVVPLMFPVTVTRLRDVIVQRRQAGQMENRKFLGRRFRRQGILVHDWWVVRWVHLQVVIRKDELEEDILEIMKGEAKVLPPWDPMGALA